MPTSKEYELFTPITNTDFPGCAPPFGPFNFDTFDKNVQAAAFSTPPVLSLASVVNVPNVRAKWTIKPSDADETLYNNLVLAEHGGVVSSSGISAKSNTDVTVSDGSTVTVVTFTSPQLAPGRWLMLAYAEFLLDAVVANATARITYRFGINGASPGNKGRSQNANAFQNAFAVPIIENVKSGDIYLVRLEIERIGAGATARVLSGARISMDPIDLT